MDIWLKTVSHAWADVAEFIAPGGELCLWHADARREWRGPSLGDLVLFRRANRVREIAEHGIFVARTLHYAQDAWDLFGFRTGAWTRDDLLAQIAARRTGQPLAARPVIAISIIAKHVFYPRLNPHALSSLFPANRTDQPLCSADSQKGRDLRAALKHHAKATLGFEEPTDRLLGRETYRIKGTSLRVMPASIRSILLQMSGHRCAITGRRVPATLKAAHVWPRKYGGPDPLENLMLLTADYHELWDAGLLAGDAAYRILVSADLPLFDPKADYFRYAGQPLRPRLTAPAYPDQAYFAEHHRRVFRWPATKPR